MHFGPARLRRAILEAVKAVEPEPLLASIDELARSLGVSPERMAETLNSLQLARMLRIRRVCPHRNHAMDCSGESTSFATSGEERFFCLTQLGRKEALADQPMPSFQERRSDHPPTILVVDDNPAVLRLIGRMLGDSYSVLLASTAAEAFDLARAHAVDLVLTDIIMPVMDGWAFAAAFRNEHPHTPILYMSGYSESAAVASGFAPGITLLQKPFRIDTLFAVVSEALSRSDNAQ